MKFLSKELFWALYAAPNQMSIPLNKLPWVPQNISSNGRDGLKNSIPGNSKKTFLLDPKLKKGILR